VGGVVHFYFAKGTIREFRFPAQFTVSLVDGYNGPKFGTFQNKTLFNNDYALWVKILAFEMKFLSKSTFPQYESYFSEENPPDDLYFFSAGARS